MIQEHVALTNSAKGKEVLDNFGGISAEIQKDQFLTTMPVC